MYSRKRFCSDGIYIDYTIEIERNIILVEIRSESDLDAKIKIENINGTLVALGNGDPKNKNKYTGNISYLYDGHALAIFSLDTKSFDINSKTMYIN